MADAEPTIRYTARSGKPVVEVGGAWTVFSMRGIRHKAEKALQAAGTAKAARLVDASGVERLDMAGALEILELAGGGPESEVKTAQKAHADLFEVVKKNMCEAQPEQHVNWLARWLEEIGHSTVNLYHQGVNLCALGRHRLARLRPFALSGQVAGGVKDEGVELVEVAVEHARRPCCKRHRARPSCPTPSTASPICSVPRRCE